MHGFHLSLVQSAIEDQLPVPAGVDAESLHELAPQPAVELLRRWLKLLDMAVPAAMIRQTLNANVDQDLAEALCRYYARKRPHTDLDRDKIDFVATFLYRNPRIAGQWQTHGYSLDGEVPVSPFEIALLEIVGDSELPGIDAQHERLLAEFDNLREDVDKFGHFEEITDSNIVSRARQLKHDLGEALYHPHSLAVIAAYNAHFGQRFDDLFRAAATHIKTFANQQQAQGGSLAARVHGEVTVKHLAELEEQKIINYEYARAQEHFRHVAAMKRAVDERLAPRRPVATSPFAPAQPAPAPKPAAAPARSEDVESGSGPASLKASESMELTKLKSVEASIRAFVRAANPHFRQIVPMKFGNFTLTPAEADAYCADYLEETSFRGDNVRSLVRMVAITARICTENEELKTRQNSTHLWKPHAESIGILRKFVEESAGAAGRVMTVAQQRGLVDKANALNSCLLRMQQKLQDAAALVASLPARG
ncbi:MAG TPA: hypothetical protein VEG32_05740 [Clostridia bacterium]|nr:hypothetical protein [Clostridia bacterium]